MRLTKKTADSYLQPFSQYYALFPKYAFTKMMKSRHFHSHTSHTYYIPKDITDFHPLYIWHGNSNLLRLVKHIFSVRIQKNRLVKSFLIQPNIRVQKIKLQKS